MTLGTYLWRNSDGTSFEIDVDQLPTTTLPANVPLPKQLMYCADPNSPDFRKVSSKLVPNFRIEVTNPATGEMILYHSTNNTDWSEYDDEHNPLHIPQEGN